MTDTWRVKRCIIIIIIIIIIILLMRGAYAAAEMIVLFGESRVANVILSQRYTAISCR